MADSKSLAFGVVLLHIVVLTFCSDHRTDVLRVAGGLPGNIVTFPWQISLNFKGAHHCGGSIISSQWVLSAAHCIEGTDINELTIRVGTSWRHAFGKIINISQIVDHPNYKYVKPNYDFTLIQLSRPLTFDKRIQPIELPDEDINIADGTLCTISGWGGTGNLNESRDFLRKVEVPIINQDECKKVWPFWLTPQMICAGYTKDDGKDACNGDSGGALTCFHEKNDSNRLLLIGVVSFGAPCNKTVKGFGTGVYARVTSVRKWIESVSGI